MKTGSSSHTHDLAEVDAALAAIRGEYDAALAAMDARIAALESGPEPPLPPSLVRIDVPSGGKGVTVTDHGQVIENLEIVGPGAAAYDGKTFGIWSSAALRDVVIRHCVIRGMGNSGMWLGNLSDLVIEDCVVEDVAYAGIMLLGAARATVRRCKVLDVTATGLPGPGNAYGLCASHIGSQVRCSDVVFEDNLVDGVPTWHGLDTHGGLRITFRRNVVRRAPRSVFMTSNGNGDKATDCLVEGNLFADPIQVTGGTNPTAMTTYATVGNRFIGNVIDPAFGAPTVYDYQKASTGLVQSGNVNGTALP